MEQAHILEMTLPFEENRLTVRMGRDAFEVRNSWSAGSHSNTDYEIHIILSGSCTLEVGSRLVELPAAHGILIRRGIFHHPWQISGDFIRFTLNLMPDSPRLEQRLFAALADFAIFPVDQQDAALCCDVFRELEADAPFRATALGAMCTRLLVNVFRYICPAQENEVSDVQDPAQQRIVIIDQFFALWMHPCGTETELAGQLNLSRRQLGRLLQEYYGMSFREKLRQSRMEYAGSLLRTTDWKIQEICQKVGYREEAAFFKIFRGYYQMTPGQYRRQMQSKKENQEAL